MSKVLEQLCNMVTQNAIVTLVMLGDAYTLGAVTLAQTLKDVGSKVARVCMVDHSVTEKARNRLSVVFDEVVEVERLSWTGEVEPNIDGFRDQERLTPWIRHVFTKFRAVGLVKYNKVLFIDADMLVVRAIDKLFNLQSPSGIWSSLGYGVLQHGLPISIQTEDRNQRHQIRGCLWMVEASLRDMKRIEDMVARYDEYHPIPTDSSPEEVILSRAYRGQWTHIHRGYCIAEWKWTNFKSMAMSEIDDRMIAASRGKDFVEMVRLSKIKHMPYFHIADFMGPKPWNSNLDYSDFKRWDNAAVRLVRSIQDQTLRQEMAEAFLTSIRDTPEKRAIQQIARGVPLEDVPVFPLLPNPENSHAFPDHHSRVTGRVGGPMRNYPRNAQTEETDCHKRPYDRDFVSWPCQ